MHHAYIVVPSTVSTLTSTTFNLLMVPRNTWSSVSFFTSFASPVSELSSNSVSTFDTMVPSHGGLDPFRTRTMSPISSKSTETLSILCPGLATRLPLSEPPSPSPFSTSRSPELHDWTPGDEPDEMSRASAGRRELSAVNASAVRALLNTSKYRPKQDRWIQAVRKLGNELTKQEKRGQEHHGVEIGGGLPCSICGWRLTSSKGQEGHRGKVGHGYTTGNLKEEILIMFLQ